ncbi:MAG: FAD-dependent thymidylate synthase [Clostridiales bacterium]|nr:FAD-dependent thymidylate synthase [Clostridiales bacterium]
MMTVKLIAHTPEPERVVAAAAKLCYSPVGVDELLEDLTPEKTAKFVKMLASMGHESPIEHASFTFAIEGVSRSLLAQITRHRIASFSVQSQRYVRLDDFQFVIPPEVEADPASKALFLEAMRKQGEEYLSLCASLQERHTAELMAQGLSRKEAEKKAEKMANEDARFVLPNACETKMVMTMNARSLKNFFALRCCNRAQWEIRTLAEEMFKLVYSVAPGLFAAAGPSCVACGHCTEGKMSCGKTKEVQEKYRAIKEAAVIPQP